MKFKGESLKTKLSNWRSCAIYRSLKSND